MYSIRINNCVEEGIKEKEVINRIIALHKIHQSLAPKVLVLEKRNECCWEIGIGDTKEKSYIMYDVYSEPEKDVLIAFNPSISLEDITTVAIFESEYRKQSRWKRNLICFSEVISELEYHLKNGKLSDKLSWHAW